ncbi:MAG: hypothetical protein SGJ05_04805 [bacterium]|nr:hypothetical protein [bacterium]
MSQVPNIDAPDGFELGVFARAMLSQLPSAQSVPGFEEAVLQKSGSTTKVRKFPRILQRGIGWKTTMASLVLLVSLGSITLFTGLWSPVRSESGSRRTQQNESTIRGLPSLPEPLPAVVVPHDLKKADASIKRTVVKIGKNALVKVSKPVKGVAGYPTQPAR